MSQNLVPNNSFEDTLNCSGGSGNISSSMGWISGYNSPDYFNPCANSTMPYIGVPNNFAGFQVPLDRNSYAGFIAYHCSMINFREIIGIKLSDTLQIGTKYFVSAYFSRGDNIFSADTVKCANNNIGFRFAVDSSDIPISINNFSHIHSASILTDTTNWVKIEGSYIADSAYQYLFIGNFYDDANTDTLNCKGYAYYYVDFVCVSTDSLYCVNSIGMNENLMETSNYAYPNPVSDFLFYKSDKNSYYTLYDLNGSPVETGRFSNGVNGIDVRALPFGFYVLSVDHLNHFKILITH